jgi:hypothetical protein
MAFRHGKSTNVLVSQYDLSAYLTEATPSLSIDTAETSTFGANAKTYVVGQNDGTISFSGLYDGATTAIDAIFSDIIDNDRTPVITINADGGLVAGNRAILAQAKQTSYEISAPVADVVSVKGEFQVTSGIRNGIILEAARVLSVTTNGTQQDNTALTSIGATANLHVTANARTATTVIKVQHSVDNVTYADLITFTTIGITSTTAESLTISGTVNRYLRAQTTISGGTGNITFSISIARRNN